MCVYVYVHEYTHVWVGRKWGDREKGGGGMGRYTDKNKRQQSFIKHHYSPPALAWGVSQPSAVDSHARK